MGWLRMKDSFEEFIEKIPRNIHSNTRSYVSTNVAVFIPEEFVIARKINTLDYHFVIFHTTPPPVKIGDITIQFKKGSFVPIEPGVDLEVLPLQSHGKVKFISISIKKEFFDRIAQEILVMKRIEFEREGKAYNHQILDLIQHWINEINAYKGVCPLMMESIENQLVIQLLRDSLPNKLKNARSKLTDNDYISKAVEYMDQYYNCHITIEEICKSIFVSPCHFQRIFKKHMNQTPYNYLMELRINKAKEKLLEENIRIEEISRQCGFVSTAHFSSVFKRIEGLSPTIYRKNNCL